MGMSSSERCLLRRGGICNAAHLSRGECGMVVVTVQANFTVWHEDTQTLGACVNSAVFESSRVTCH